MRKSNHSIIRTLLKQNPDGLMVREIAKQLNLQHRATTIALKTMVDTYIDRWVKLPSAPMAAVWCIIEVPEDCPKP
jgi:predicted lipid carrier protein YhbT